MTGFSSPASKGRIMFVRARVTKERVRVWKRVCADMKEGINCCGLR
jgi:hypothetical protein